MRAMAFSVRLAADSFQVEPGSSVAVAVEVKNQSSERDQFELAIEGLEHHWTAIPVPSFTVEPGETRVERFFLKPPRDTESSAGNYPFVVRVRSLESGAAEICQGDLVINAYHHLSLDITPRRTTVSPIRRATETSLTLMNLGNVEQTVQLFANDVDDVFAYEFSEEQVTLSPGQQKNVSMVATLTQSSPFAPTRLHVVTVSCRNVDNPAYAATVQAQVEQRPILAPGALFGLVALLVVAFLWIATIPKPPKILSVTKDKSSVAVGDPVTVSWDSEGATSVTLTYGSETVLSLPPKNHYVVTPSEAGDLEISVQAVNGDRKSEPKEVVVSVTAPIVAPDPKILDFSASKTSVPVGDDFILNFKVSDNVTSLYLEPLGDVSPTATSQIAKADTEPGSRTYRLIAKNKDGKAVSKELTVQFVQVPLAKITRFDASPLVVDPLDGRVTLAWQLTNAVSATIEYDGQKFEIDATSSRRDFSILKDTTFTLTAYDSNGLKATKEITVKVKQPPDATGEGTVTPITTTGGDANPPKTTTGN